MAFSKIILNGVTQIDLTQDTTQADKTIQGYTGHQNDGTGFTGSYVPPTGDDVPTYTYDANNETFVCNKTYEEIYTGNYTYAIFDDDGYEIVCDKSITGVSYILWTYNLSFDLRHNSDESITIIEPSRYALTLNVSDNGTYTPSSGYAYTQVNVNIESELQEKTITPTTQTQVVTADTDTTLVDALTCTISASSTSQSFSYDWGNLAIGETYHVVGGGTVSGNGTSGTVTIDTEIVLGQGDNTIPYVGASRVLGTITVKKTGIAPGVTITFDGTNNSGSIELAFYGTYDGLNQVTVNPIPSEYIIPTGTKSITANGTGIDVAAYATVDVNVPSSGGSIVISDTLDSHGGIIKTITTTGETITLQSKTVTPSSVQQTITPDSGYTGLSEVIVNGNNELLYKALIERKVTGAVVATGIEDISSQSLSNLPTSVTSIRFPDLIKVRGSYAVANSKGITVAVFEKPLTITSSELLYKCTNLTTVDMNLGAILGSGYAFEGDTLLTTLILRNTTLYGLNAISSFKGTPFASGGNGGTIYIPKVLYDHLGDGGSSDYQAATNWSVLHGYGTVTWAQIEGSQYENYYADGTPIS